MERLGKLFKFLRGHELDCILVKDVPTIRYLTGFTGDSSLLYADDRVAILLTDGRYTEQARSQMKYCRVLEYKPASSHAIWDAAVELIGAKARVGFDADAYSYTEGSLLGELLPESARLVPVDLRPLRMVKDERELKSLWQAFKIADAAFEHLLKELHSGMSEKEAAARLEYYMRSLGSEGVSFDTIVASGYRSALPHGAPTDKTLEVGDFVTFDYGAICDGYHSDTTRTVVLGMANSWHREIYTIVEEAHYRGIKNAKPGMTGKVFQPWPGSWRRAGNPRAAQHQLPRGRDPGAGHGLFHRAGDLHPWKGRRPHRGYGGPDGRRGSEPDGTEGQPAGNRLSGAREKTAGTVVGNVRYH